MKMEKMEQEKEREIKRFGKKVKQLMVKEIKDKVEKSQAQDKTSHIFITSFNAVGVCEQDELRRELEKIESDLFVVKNRIAKRTFKELNQEAVTSLLQGLTAICLGRADPVLIAKTLEGFAKKCENFRILGAYVDKQLLNKDSVKRLACIPAKEILLAQIVRGINSPIQNLVNTLSGTIKKLLVVLDRIREKSENEGEKGIVQ